MTLAQGTSPHRVDPHPRAPQALRSAQIDAADPDPVHALKRGLGPGPFAMVTLFVSPDANFARITHEAHQAFPGAEVLACTTAGEIGVTGSAGAIANAVWHVTGKRIRRFPIRVADMFADHATAG